MAGKTASVLVIYTGGTFGMVPDASRPGQPLVPGGLDQLKRTIGETCAPLPKISTTIIQSAKLIDSSSATSRDWLDLARMIEHHYAAFDGFVVIHGTDTLSYGASLLAFLFENLGKPIVFTGSQIPISEVGSDAPANYSNAVQVAGAGASGLAIIPEVVVLFAGRILRGCRSTKYSAQDIDAFRAPNSRDLGRIRSGVTIDSALVLPKPSKDFRLNIPSPDPVLEVTLFPGITARQIEALIASTSCCGLVLRTFGAGNIPDAQAILDVLGQFAAQKGNMVVNISQCIHGQVQMDRYGAAAGLSDAGIVPGYDMTREAAFAKLQVGMGKTEPLAQRQYMLTCQRGEMTV